MTSVIGFFFFVKQKTAYEMRISDWSSDVCSSDLGVFGFWEKVDGVLTISPLLSGTSPATATLINGALNAGTLKTDALAAFGQVDFAVTDTLSLIAGGRYSWVKKTVDERSEEHTSELQSLMRISYAVFCLKKQKRREN